METRITKKLQQIAKMEKNLVKYVVNDEFTKICDRYFETGDRTELTEYKKSHDMWCLSEYYSKRYDLENAKKQLQKLYQLQQRENAKRATLSELPDVLVAFKNQLIENWDAYDSWKKSQIRIEYHNVCELRGIENSKAYSELTHKWGFGFYDFMCLSDEKIHENNVKDAEKLILNMIERTIELTGKITDCKYLSIHSDNQGYAIINGIIIGENGKARIESIGAGGYNIQRYHIRVLVKEVK